jgi:ferrochelatase
MKADGIGRALAFVTSAYSSYSSCRQYRDDIVSAQAAIGKGAPVVDKIRPFYNHPGFIEAAVDRVREALEKIAPDRREAVHLIYTAHSIPLAMAQSCDYEKQLQNSCKLVADQLGYKEWRLVYQSRSGPPSQPWLEPDILDCLRELKADGANSNIVVVPIGFVSDHMEIVFDLDTQARELCDELGLSMLRARTVGTHPRFIAMIGELIRERTDEHSPRLALGAFGPRPDMCPADCCPTLTRQQHSLPNITSDKTKGASSEH